MIKRQISKIALSGFLLAAGALLTLFLVEIGLRIWGVDYATPEQFGEMQVDPMVGWTYRPSQLRLICNRSIRPECVSFRTNARALREDVDTSLAPPMDTRRILVIGDSQTAGEYVENRETFSHLLEELLLEDPCGGEFEVVNGAVPAYSPVQEWLWFRELGRLYQPEITIAALYVGNDLIEMVTEGPAERPYMDLTSDNVVELRSYPVFQPYSRGVRDSRGPVEAVKTILRPLRVYQLARSALRSSLLAEFLRDIELMEQDPVWSADLAPADPRPRAASLCHGCVLQSLSQSYYFTIYPDNEETAFRLLEETLRLLAIDVDESGAELILVIIPTKLMTEAESEPRLEEVLAGLDMSRESAVAFDERIHERFVQLGLQLGIETIDLVAGLRSYRLENPDEALYFAADWHLSTAGHKAAALSIYGSLADHMGLPLPESSMCSPRDW